MTNYKDIHGILLLDKPVGITSHAVLQKVRRFFKARKAGHGGSLDPVASGLLPICFGEATKFSRFLLEADKHYQTTLMLGIRTDSGDSAGKILSLRPVESFSLTYLESILDQFKGNICQIPPMYSAIKYQGRPLYKLARQGIEVERHARSIFIHLLRIVAWRDNFLTLEVRASKGTYIRTLGDEIGEALGCGAHVVTLRRLGVGGYNETHMHSFEVLEKAFHQGESTVLESCLLPVDEWIKDIPKVMLSETAAYYLKQGQSIVVPDAPQTGWVRLLQDQQFLGIGEILPDGRIAPRRLTHEVIWL